MDLISFLAGAASIFILFVVLAVMFADNGPGSSGGHQI